MILHWGSRQYRRFIELIAVTYELYRAGRGTLVAPAIQPIEAGLRMIEDSMRYWTSVVLTNGR